MSAGRGSQLMLPKTDIQSANPVDALLQLHLCDAEKF